MIRRIEVTGLFLFLMMAIILIGAVPIGAQGYGGMYGGGGSSSGSSGGGSGAVPTPRPYSTPTPTPTPRPQGSLSLSATYLSGGSQSNLPVVEPEGDLTVVVSMTAFGMVPGQYTLSAMALDKRVGHLSPTRISMAGSGLWRVHLQAGAEPGRFPILIVAQDILGNHKSASMMVQVEIGADPMLVTPNLSILPTIDTKATRLQHRSWWGGIRSRSKNYFEYLCHDIVNSYAWQQTIHQATKTDRDRLNITGTMAPMENYTSYANFEKIMSRYWADGGITVNIVTLNQLGTLTKTWRAAPNSVVNTVPSIGSALRMKVTAQPISAGNVLNGVGGAMILLDFWANMASAETPIEAREAWYSAGFASLDMYLATIVGNTFGSAAALPGMMVSYILTNSYNTLIGGYKNCWFKKMVEQALDADLLSEDINDTQAVNNVKRAMLSKQGLKGKLMEWWSTEAPYWAGKMGGCGNWELAEARGYREAFVDRIMRTNEVEINGKRYHPVSFYYSVSRMLVIDERRKKAREVAEGIRKTEAAYLSTLANTTYQGRFRVVSADNPNISMSLATVFPTEMEREMQWTTDSDGWFIATIQGHHFSPKNTVMFTIRSMGDTNLFVVPQDAFEKVSP